MDGMKDGEAGPRGGPDGSWRRPLAERCAGAVSMPPRGRPAPEAREGRTRTNVRVLGRRTEWFMSTDRDPERDFFRDVRWRDGPAGERRVKEISYERAKS